MKVLFLDIDGVINTPGAELGFKNMGMGFGRRKPRELTEDSILTEYSRVFDPSAIYHLGRIIRETEAKIVVSSTWRNGSDLKEMKGWFLDPVIAEAIIGKTDSFYSTSHPDLVDKEGRVQRGEEIYAWVQEHSEVTKYAILDDDSDMDAVRGSFFRTDGWDGLNRRTADKVIAYLNKENRISHYRLNHALHDFYSEIVSCLSDIEKSKKESFIKNTALTLDLLCEENDLLREKRYREEEEAENVTQ